MPDSALIRVAEDNETIFREILTSLESQRPAKSETDILENIRAHFDLPNERQNWPEFLISKACPVEEFLDFVLEQLAPFVQMVLELYSFFSKTVSTTGGRTTHFEIRGGLNSAVQFPSVEFPRKVQWIHSWAEVQIESVAIDWQRIGNALRIDNGIFYGTVKDIRVIQSLIIARRDQQLSPVLRTQADRICTILRRAVRAWHAAQRARRLEQELSEPARWLERVFVPDLNHLLIQKGVINIDGSEVGVDLERVLAADGVAYDIEEIFCDPALDENAANAGEESARHNWDVQSALFFITLWGLNEDSFRTVAELLTVHERSSTLFGLDWDSRGPNLTAEAIKNLEAAIVPTGQSTTSIQKIRKKLEILLLPYWKDRWFLYEVWTLCLPMIEVLALAGRVDLLGVRPIENADIDGTTWNLPTQKARAPVAKLTGLPDEEPVFVWFQRETRSAAEPRNIEPDVRITSAAEPYADLMIIECKDRIKFSRKSAEDVAMVYLRGRPPKWFGSLIMRRSVKQSLRPPNLRNRMDDKSVSRTQSDRIQVIARCELRSEHFLVRDSGCAGSERPVKNRKNITWQSMSQVRCSARPFQNYLGSVSQHSRPKVPIYGARQSPRLVSPNWKSASRRRL